jgi:hypothetical protein
LIVSTTTLEDLAGCLRASVVFTFVLLTPGYLLGWTTNLLGFRKRPGGVRLVWSIALSFSTITIASVLLAKFVSLNAVCWFAAISGLLGLWLILRDIWTGNILLKISGIQAMGIGAMWIFFVALELMDIGVGPHLFFSSTVYDHAQRTAFVDAVVRTGVPPANPLFWPGHAAPMRYYYFWYVLTAAVVKLAQTTARQAMIASAAWAGIGIAAIVTLFCWHFLRWPPKTRVHLRITARRHRRVTIAIALLAVTGMDLLPVLGQALAGQPTDPDMEWWSQDQVASWMDTVLWVPHHAAGLICCLFGFLLVWLSKRHGILQRLLCILFAGCAFASAFGLSTWIAIAFAIVLLTWCAWVTAWEHLSRRRLPVLLGAALFACVLLMPYLLELQSGISAPPALQHPPARSSIPPHSAFSKLTSGASAAAHLFRFQVRHIIDPSFLEAIPGLNDLAEDHPQIEDAIASLIVLAPGYLAELGFYALILVAAFIAIRRFALDEPARTALFFSISSLVVATFLRSTVLTNNDFGMRSILIAQFFLLILAVTWSEGTLGKTSRVRFSIMKWLLWIGLAGTVYQVFVLRLYLPVEQKLGRPAVADLAEQAMVMRLGFDAMDRRIPQNAVVQFNPTQPDQFVRFAQIMQVRRQVASSFPQCNIDFGGDKTTCAPVEQGVHQLFDTLPISGRPTAQTALEARSICHSLGIDALIATSWDTVWLDPDGWVWRLPVLVDSTQMRVLDCSSPMR